MRRVALSTLAVFLIAAPGLAGVDDATWNEAVAIFKEDFKKKSIGFKKRCTAFARGRADHQRSLDGHGASAGHHRGQADL